MSKFLHDVDDDARAMIIPRRSRRSQGYDNTSTLSLKTAELKIKVLCIPVCFPGQLNPYNTEKGLL